MGRREQILLRRLSTLKRMQDEGCDVSRLIKRLENRIRHYDFVRKQRELRAAEQGREPETG